MDRHLFVTIVQREARASHDDADRAARATLQTLGERLSNGEAHELARHLPLELATLLEGGRTAPAFDADEFVRRVAERENTAPATAAHHARSVAVALGQTLSADELADLASELPPDLSELLNVTAVRYEAHAPRAA